MENYIKLNSIDDILYHLATKEIVVFNLKDGFGYIEQIGNDFNMIIQPNHGSATIAKGNRGLVRKTLKGFHNTEFYVIPGLQPQTKRATVLDKAMDFFKNLKSE